MPRKSYKFVYTHSITSREFSRFVSVSFYFLLFFFFGEVRYADNEKNESSRDPYSLYIGWRWVGVWGERWFDFNPFLINRLTWTTHHRRAIVRRLLSFFPLVFVFRFSSIGLRLSGSLISLDFNYFRWASFCFALIIFFLFRVPNVRKYNMVDAPFPYYFDFFPGTFRFDLFIISVIII